MNHIIKNVCIANYEQDGMYSMIKQTIGLAKWSVPAAVLIGALAVKLVGRKDGEYPFLRAEVLPFDSGIRLQVVGQHWTRRTNRKRDRQY